jgi:hypothetical protein
VINIVFVLGPLALDVKGSLPGKVSLPAPNGIGTEVVVDMGEGNEKPHAHNTSFCCRCCGKILWRGIITVVRLIVAYP